MFPSEDNTTIRSTVMGPPRFTVRTLLVVTAFVGVSMATLRLLGPIWAWVLFLFFAAVAAHVAGNVIGRRLVGQPMQRRVATQPTRRQGSESKPSELRVDDGASTSPLRDRRPLGVWLLCASFVSGAFGGVVSVFILMRVNPDAASVRTLAFGAVAGGTLSGMWVYWMLSLMRVAGAAWYEAHQTSNRAQAASLGRAEPKSR